MDLFHYDSQIINQYLILAVVVSIVLAIKYYTVRKSYDRKLDSFIHPDLLLPDVLAKLKKLPNYDPRILLAQNLRSLESDLEKIRNVSILIALMKQEGLNLDPFKSSISSIFADFDKKEKAGEAEWKEYQKKYRNYITEAVKW